MAARLCTNEQLDSTRHIFFLSGPGIRTTQTLPPRSRAVTMASRADEHAAERQREHRGGTFLHTLGCPAPVCVCVAVDVYACGSKFA